MSYYLYLGQYRGLVLLLITYTTLVMAYSYVIPFSKGPDEYINYQYILFITKHRRLPATIFEKEEAGVKADWQPLYHLVSGIVATPIALDPLPELKVTWQPPTRQLIDIELPRATLVRTEDERSPHRGVYAIWQMGRWVSLALGAGTLIITYLIGLMIWPGQPALATAATALLVFTPRFLFTHAVLSDDTMLGFCLAVYLLLVVRLVRGQASGVSSQKSVASRQKAEGRRQKATVGSQASGIRSQRSIASGLRSPVSGRYWLFIGLGLTAGLAIVTKYTAIPVVLAALVTSSLVAWRQGWRWQVWLQCSAIFIGALALAVSWWVGWVWWHFNQVDQLGPVMGLLRPLLPGATIDDNPTTARLTAFLSGQSVEELGEAAGASGNFIDWAWHSFVTFWGVTVFGAEPAWPYPYGVILVGMALFCALAVVGLGILYRRAEASDKIIWLVFVWHGLLFLPLPLLRFALSGRLNDAAQGRHLLFTAGPAIVMILLAGWLAWFQPRWRSWVAWLIGGLMLAWGISHLAYLWSAYPPPLPVRTTLGPQLEVKQSTQINFGDILLLTGYQTEQVNQGAILQVDLLWQSLAQTWEDYRTEVTLVDRQNRPQLRWVSQPAQGRFPVRAWQPGDWVRDTLHIPLVGLSPGEYEVQLRLLGWGEPLLSGSDEITTLTTVTLDNVPQLPVAVLWQQEKIIGEDHAAYSSVSSFPHLLSFSSQPTYRYRSTIPVTLPSPAKVALIGPNGQPQLPVTDVGHLRAFIVDYNWPSGDYRLQVDGKDSHLGLRVENFDLRPAGWKFTPPAITYQVQANFADKVELLGYDLPLRRVEAGGGVPLVLYWRSLTQMRESYTIFVQLLDSALQRRGGYDRLPRETYPTYLWVSGEVVDDGFAVPVDAGAPSGIYTIRIGLYHQENGQAQPLSLMQNGQPLEETSLVIGPLKVGGPPAGVMIDDTVAPEHPLTINLGKIIALRGYDLNLQKQTIQVKLYWQSLVQTQTDYTVFVHLRHDSGQIVAQADGPPMAGGYPTSLWDSGEIIPDTFTLSLPPSVEPGVYQLVAGLYDPLTGARLAVPGAKDNSVLLSQIEINDSQDSITLSTK